MEHFGEPALQNWIEDHHIGVPTVVAGSAAPPMSLKDLKSISQDRAATAKALDYDNVVLRLGDKVGDPELRKRVAALYDQSKATVTADDVVISNGTTGANFFVLEGLISRGDHVITLYPVYESLIDIPRYLGADISYWRLKEENGWKPDIEELRSILRPSTKMIILNNPHNPTGYVFSTEEQAEVIKLAKEHNIIVFTDEIFRPLFHTGTVPTSILEHGSYDRTVAAGSLSKVWGMSGVRIGWVVSRDPKIREACVKVRAWAVQTVSVIDEIIAREVLSDRCKNKIITNTLANAHGNLPLLKAFAQDHKQSVSCTLPIGGATAFIQFRDAKTGEPVDDVQLCLKLKEECGVLLSPGSSTFGQLRKGDFKGYVRMHLTAPKERFQKGLDGVARFLTDGSFANLTVNGF